MTSVPKTPVGFVDGIGFCIVSVDHVPGARDLVLTIVLCLLDPLAV